MGTMIKHQPLYIKGIDAKNQELTKESAFGAMGMFIFLFAMSVGYLCMKGRRDDEHAIRAQGYMRPQMQAGGMRMSDYQVEMPRSESSHQIASDDHHEHDHEHDEFAPVLLS